MLVNCALHCIQPGRPQCHSSSNTITFIVVTTCMHSMNIAASSVTPSIEVKGIYLVWHLKPHHSLEIQLQSHDEHTVGNNPP